MSKDNKNDSNTIAILENLLDTEQKLFSNLEARKRLLEQLRKVDTEIYEQKSLLLHKLKANEMSESNFYKLVKVNLEREVTIKEVVDVLPNRTLLDYLVVKVEYNKTIDNLSKVGIIGVNAQKLIEQIQSLQKDEYLEIEDKVNIE